MKVYLAHAKANYASPNDGYVNALRACDFTLTLYSFQFLEGQQRLPIHESISSSRGRELLARERLGGRGEGG